jgi:polysaccharide pyruvyl transferase WcaK-like protein
MTSILILAGDGDGNLGDRAILQAMCSSFGELMPALRLMVVSENAARARLAYGAEAIPRGLTGLLDLVRAIRHSSLVIVGGGGLFQDDDSLVKMPYWALRVGLARVLGRPVVGYALGVGPLAWPLSRAFARLAFAFMQTVTVRDPEAKRVAQALCTKPVAIVPDPAFGLSPAPASVARARLLAAGIPVGERPIIGVALRRWFPPRARLIPHRFARRLGLPDPQRGPSGERLLDLLARALDEIVEAHGAFVLFLPSYAVAHEGDDALCRAVLGRMKRPHASVLVLDDAQLYKACCGQLTAMLGGRMHPMILAAAMGTPVVGLAYNPKFHGLLAMLGQPDSCLDVVDLVCTGDTRTLVRLLDTAIRSGPCRNHRAEELARQVRSFDATVLEMLR